MITALQMKKAREVGLGLLYTLTLTHTHTHTHTGPSGETGHHDHSTADGESQRGVLELLYCIRSIYSHFVADSYTHSYIKPALLAVSRRHSCFKSVRHACMHALMHALMHAHMQAHVHTCAHMHMHAHTHRQTHTYIYS